jgi:glucose-1-phosphate cytidylyltransferase
MGTRSRRAATAVGTYRPAVRRTSVGSNGNGAHQNGNGAHPNGNGHGPDRRGLKVVLFCGGLGIRMGEATERIPKPMIQVGPRPILLHIMKWYAAWGHTDFILCLGYRAEVIKQYFLDYRDALTNDFILSNGGRDLQLLGADISDWKITFLDTGVQATIGERLQAAAPHLGDDEYFLANYGDGLGDPPLDDMVDTLETSGKTGLFMMVRPQLSYHMVDADQHGLVRAIQPMASADVFINGGYFVFRRDILDELRQGEELVEEAFSRLAERESLLAYRYDGFWAPMDTVKDKQNLDALWETGRAPWNINAVTSVPVH